MDAINLLKNKGFIQDLATPLAYPGFNLSAIHLHEIVPGGLFHLGAAAGERRTGRRDIGRMEGEFGRPLSDSRLAFMQCNGTGAGAKFTPSRLAVDQLKAEHFVIEPAHRLHTGGEENDPPQLQLHGICFRQ